MLAFMAQFAAIFGSFGGHNDDDEGGGTNIVGLLIIAIVMPIAATLIRLAISRAREYQADQTGAHNCGDPDALARALEKLEMDSEMRPMKVNEAASHLFIVNPLSGKSMARLFSTHPPIEERCRRLRAMNVRPRFDDVDTSGIDMPISQRSTQLRNTRQQRPAKFLIRAGNYNLHPLWHYWEMVKGEGERGP